ncbi:MAG: peptidase, partial [Clostridia bacterium]|nr:peptidase [Clostridia bacterium]
MEYVFIALVALIVIIIISNIIIVPQANEYVIERLGRYKTVMQAGFHIKVPFIEKVARKVVLKEQVVVFLPQPVITQYNVTMQIDTVV